MDKDLLESTIWGLFQSTGMIGYYMFWHEMQKAEDDFKAMKK